MENKMFERTLTISATAAFLGFGLSAASAQEMTFPEKCKMSGDMAARHEQMMKGHDMSAMKADYQKEFMEGMNKTMPLMMEGMMKDDADVAFVCGMIAHHMGAVEMSRTELKHGDNEEPKAMAQRIIEAQLKEIEEMSRWVEANAK
jgi:uncharacterized protein (DUF305 family)